MWIQSFGGVPNQRQNRVWDQFWLHERDTAERSGHLFGKSHEPFPEASKMTNAQLQQMREEDKHAQESK